MLVCSECGDRRPDADVRNEGMSLGARCVQLDCGGTYQDDDAYNGDGTPNYASVQWDGPL